MTELQQGIIEDLIESEIDFGNQTFSWNGNSYLCCPSGKHTDVAPDVGTMDVSDSMTMTVRQFDAKGKSVFPDGILPTGSQKGKQYVTFGGRRWLIKSVDKDSFNACIRLWLIDDTRGFNGR